MFRSIPSTKAKAGELIGRKGPSTFTTVILEDAFEIEPLPPPRDKPFRLPLLVQADFRAIDHREKTRETGEKRDR